MTGAGKDVKNKPWLASHLYSDKGQADIEAVQNLIRAWHQRNEPADEDGFTMAEFIVLGLYQSGRLS